MLKKMHVLTNTKFISLSLFFLCVCVCMFFERRVKGKQKKIKMGESKGHFAQWLRTSSPLIDTTRYFDSFIQFASPYEDIPDPLKRYWKQYGKNTYDHRNRIVFQQIDAMIVDGSSILFSPKTNYNFSRSGEKVTLIDRKKQEGTDLQVKATIGEVAEGFAKIIVNAFETRHWLKNFILAFEKTRDFPVVAKRRTWFERDVVTTSNELDVQSFVEDEPLGSTEYGTFDYHELIRNREWRNRFVDALCDKIEMVMLTRKEAVTKTHRIAIETPTKGTIVLGLFFVCEPKLAYKKNRF